MSRAFNDFLSKHNAAVEAIMAKPNKLKSARVRIKIDDRINWEVNAGDVLYLLHAYKVVPLTRDTMPTRTRG
jgi:hypothetical protein